MTKKDRGIIAAVPTSLSVPTTAKPWRDRLRTFLACERRAFARLIRAGEPQRACGEDHDESASSPARSSPEWPHGACYISLKPT